MPFVRYVIILRKAGDRRDAIGLRPFGSKVRLSDMKERQPQKVISVLIEENGPWASGAYAEVSNVDARLKMLGTVRIERRQPTEIRNSLPPSFRNEEHYHWGP